MHHTVILVVLLIRTISMIGRIPSIAACQLHVGRRLHADARVIRDNALVVNFALVDALVASAAAHVSYLT